MIIPNDEIIKREALKKTKLALKEKYESSFYWGAFVLVGE